MVSHRWALQPRTLDEQMHRAETARRMTVTDASSLVSADAERVEMIGILADLRGALEKEIDAERGAMRPWTGDCGRDAR